VSAADPATAWVDGRPCASVSVLDRGLHFGDGLFETIACCRGRPRFLALHLERLALGCERLRLAGVDFAALRREVATLAAEQDRALIKVLVTRGIATARGYAARGDEHATRIVLRYAWPTEAGQPSETGVAARVAQLRLAESPALAGLKHLNRLELVLARAELADPEVFELLLLSQSGRVVSGSMSNVFIVQHGALRTPRITLAGVAGVMRRVVLTRTQAHGLPVSEADLSMADLASAEEIFLTNARIGIYPVRALDGRALVPGPITRRVQALLASALDNPQDP